MGKTKKKYNWKSRQVVKTAIDKSEQRKIEIDLRPDGHYDEANPLVLPSQKRKTQIIKEKSQTVRLLSKKKRKQLEKIVERKKKKANRETLLEELSKVQASSIELSKMVSIAAAQTKGLKRRYNEEEPFKDLNTAEKVESAAESNDKEAIVINTIKGAKKRLRLMAAVNSFDKENSKKRERDLNVVGFESSSDDESEVEDQLENVEIKQEVIEDDDEKAENASDNSVAEIPHNDEDISEALLISNGSADNTNENTNKLAEVLENGDESAVVMENSDKSAVVLENGDKLALDLKNGVTRNTDSEKPTEDGGNTVNVKKENIDPPDDTPRKPAVYVAVDRKPAIQEARLKLPILAEEQVIMETINENTVVIIAGETGSGKTTQVPQFLYEAGYTSNGRMIGVTEPRRVAAISMAKRVGEELNLGSDEVSYLIRFEGNTTPNTKIKFMTDGVLLKEMSTDFLLTKYSVIILDEAHERSVYTDILMGLLSRVVIVRKMRKDPLKLIIMSATLRLEDFTENKNLFKTTPPVIKVEARQFPVSVHFNKRTNPDYVKEAYRKTCKIHTQLPDGGILIFLTGQQEVNTLVSKLRKAFPFRKITKKADLNTNESDNTNHTDKKEEAEDEEVELDLNNAMQRIKKKKKEKKVALPEISLDDYDIAPNDDTEQDLLASDEETDDEDWDEEMKPSNAPPLWVLPLYSVLPSKEQAKVFQGAPEGCRLCVVATNVAETSLTIPDVKYVVDTGKVKTKLYDKVTGVSGFKVTWTSKAAANQRAGRAGRTSPGHCYRLYSSAVFNDEFEGWTVPEIQRRPIDELVLQMKSLGISKVVNFPFPTPPDIKQLKTAEKRLIYLGALQRTEQVKKGKDSWMAKLTPLGAAMAKFPVAPRYAKMLCLSHQHNLLEYTVALVSALSIQELLQTVLDGDTKTKNQRLSWAGQGNFKLLGDAMVLLRAIGGAEFANSRGKLEEFCNEHKIRLKGLVEARKIRIQLTNEINLSNPDLNLVVNPKMEPPSDLQAKLLRQVVLSGMVDQVARKIDEPQEASAKHKPIYHTPLLEDPVQIHSSSVLYREYPEWIVYQEIYETTKIYLRGITAIEPEWLPIFAPALCRVGAPLENPPPCYDPSTELINCHVSGTFGKRGWELPVVEMEFPACLDKYKWFAMLFLDGTLFPKLRKFTKNLLSTPKTMIRSWARLQSKTEYFLKMLISKEVDSKKKLLEVWKTDSQYLLPAYRQWLPTSLHNEVAIMWPPIGLPPHHKED